MDLSVVNLDSLDHANFNVDEFVKMIAAKDIYASKIAETKEKLSRLSTQTAEEIKQNVYKNYTNFMETSKEVGHLESKMNQLRQSLDDQRKLLTLFKNLSANSSTKVDESPSNKSLGGQNSSLSLLLEQVEGCGVIAQKPGRSLLFHSDLEVLHTDDYSLSQKVHAYLLSDALLLTLPQRKRNKSTFSSSAINRHRSNSLIGHTETTNNYQYKFHAFYELDLINILNIEDSKEVRNSFQVSKFPESLIFRCANAHLKKEWLESIENSRKQLLLEMSSKGLNRITEEEEDETDKSAVSVEYEKSKQLRDLFSEFDILLAQRDFEKAVDMLLKIKSSKVHSDSSQHLVYKQKEAELIGILRKDLVQSKERRNSKGVVKTGKRVVNSLIKLKIIDEAIDLFIDYHKHLNSETLRKIKLEESNSIYMNNVLDSFFENLRQSYASFKEQFANLVNYCYSTYLSWCDTEIEILIKKLQSQHYLGRQFDITIENVQLIFLKADEFLSAANFEVKFMFEVKLNRIVEQSIKEQYDILIDASLQRSKLELENTGGNNEQNKQQQIDKFVSDIHLLELKNSSKFDANLIKKCTSSAIQFTRGALLFFVNCLRIYYQDINYFIVENFTKLFKAELKIYTSYIKKLDSIRIGKEDIYNNICLVESVFQIIQEIYLDTSGLSSKHFSDVSDKIVKFKKEYF
ncbi:exocyst complex component 8 [Brachionus plicatilis]|uniref:Exocyst complex component 8 n=1 Tax=Brachionus plicatilis TaxID=10195 RepID=A0A3M7QM49_BRAPC|nr:exocyst complex component 8 [Brachionus plicatilis]